MRQQIAGKLFDREFVERQVAVEGADDPLAPLPHVAIVINMIAVGVGVTRQIQPELRQPLAERGRGQQTVHQPLVRLWALVREKRVRFRNRRRQTRQIEAHSPKQRGPVRLARRT